MLICHPLFSCPSAAPPLPGAWAGGAGGGVVDSAALGEFAETVTGRDGVLANAARTGVQSDNDNASALRSVLVAGPMADANSLVSAVKD